MQLANVARHSRRCARDTIERTSRRRPLSSTSIVASGDQATWVVAPRPARSSSLVEPQSLPVAKLDPSDESRSSSSSSNGSGSSSNGSSSSGNNDSSRLPSPSDLSASSVDTGELKSTSTRYPACSTRQATLLFTLNYDVRTAAVTLQRVSAVRTCEHRLGYTQHHQHTACDRFSSRARP
ncbi:unnamed protein product [Laminaria digitata]